MTPHVQNILNNKISFIYYAIGEREGDREKRREEKESVREMCLWVNVTMVFLVLTLTSVDLLCKEFHNLKFSLSFFVFYMCISIQFNAMRQLEKRHSHIRTSSTHKKLQQLYFAIA